ncbi:jg16890 [Pararge aegeria aegeria]|uniref:UBX domain-containing protein 4 n=2 Tax=Pararge aegeria TaxID=116150 RepID=A0A8S4SHU7_9NEOP|nr:jg16890 [Pararge aegeria aegeria]
MHWYGGSMAEAVTLSKQRNAIFVVFVEDENQLSKELAETLEDGAVMQRLSNQDNFLAVKLKSGSENYTFFAQIYQFVPVPSLFFIGRNGTPLEVVCAGVQPEQLATRIDRILEEHRQEEKPGSVQPSTSSHNIKEETVNFMQSEAASLTSQSQPKPVEKIPDVAASVPQSAQSVPQSTPTVPSSVPSVPQTTPSVLQSTQKENDVEPETSSGPAAKIQKTEHNEVTRSGQEFEVICDGDVCVRRPKEDQPGPSQKSEPSPPETVSQEEKPGSVQPSTSSHNIKEETVNFMQSEAASLTSQSQPKPVEKIPDVAASVPQSAQSVPQSTPTVPSSVPSVPQTTPSVLQSTQKENDVEPETSSGPAAKIQKTEHNEVTRSGQEFEVICDGDVCVRRPKEDQPGPSQKSEPSPPETAPVIENENTALADDKVSRAQELLNARRREKEEIEKELERQKEMDRRAVGQGVAELKKWQADQEMKQIQEERKREKKENNLARQRILEQIAQDRAERKAREQPLPAPSAPAQVVPPSILFQLTRSTFSLWTAFPRRELTEVDATLQELQLAPSAALLVLQRRTETVAATPNMFASIITFFTQIFTSMVLDPSYQLYSWLRSHVGNACVVKKKGLYQLNNVWAR